MFSEKLGNYEAKVNPELWNSIASQIGATGAAAGTATGLSLVAKWVIGVSIAGAITATALIINNYSTVEDQPQQTIEDTNPVAEVATDTHNTIDDAVISPDGINAAENSTVVDPSENETASPASPDTREEPVVHTEVPFVPVTSGHEQERRMGEPGPPATTPVGETERKIQEALANREHVHTDDPIVNDPTFPEEVPAEEQKVEEKYYRVGALPNVFTPNGDRINDIFEVESENLTDFHVVVINSNNSVVFESNDPDFKWDGRDRSGQIVPAGTYVYFITAKEFGTEKPKRYSPLRIEY